MLLVVAAFFGAGPVQAQEKNADWVGTWTNEKGDLVFAKDGTFTLEGGKKGPAKGKYTLGKDQTAMGVIKEEGDKDALKLAFKLSEDKKTVTMTFPDAPKSVEIKFTKKK